MFPLLLIIYLAYRNSVRAKLKDESPLKWSVLTAASCIGTMMIGIMIVFSYFSHTNVTLEQLSTMDIKARDSIMEQVISYPLNMLTIYIFSVGGYFAMRYFLDKKPNKKNPEVHWMDKINNG